MSEATMTHYGDPCIHCLIPHDNVPSGPCGGDAARAIPIAYRSLGVRWDGDEHFLVLLSDGRRQDRHYHIAQQAPYTVFQGVRYDAELPR